MRFAVIGLSHAHIFSMTEALLSVPGVTCEGFCPEDTPVATGFAGRFADLPRRSRDDLLGDPTIDLILCADVNGLRGSVLVAALKAGKHVFVDKPPVTTVEQLDAVKRAAEYSGRLFFEDFGDAWFESDGGTAGYVRVDWFTPDALPTWGDIRQMLVGSDGTLELRNNINVGSADPKAVLLLTTRSTAPQEVDVADVDVAWAPHLVADIRDGVNRLMPHEGTFDALRSVLSMQQQAERAGLKT